MLNNDDFIHADDAIELSDKGDDLGYIKKIIIKEANKGFKSVKTTFVLSKRVRRILQKKGFGIRNLPYTSTILEKPEYYIITWNKK